MQHGHHPHALLLDECAVLSGDAQVGLYQPHAGDPAEGDDDLGADDARLLAQISDAALLLVLLRIAVLRRTAFDDVGDVDVFAAVEVDGVQQLVEELTGSADEGLALYILLLAGTFADEHDASLGIADAENNVFALFAQATGCAAHAF